jgi:hypothetical protein
MPQVVAAFNVSCEGQTLTPTGRESLSARCAEFLRSTNVEDERLKLYLTQSYFFTQLLGMQGLRFDPLAEAAFAGAVLYLDTNTLLPRLLQGEAKVMFDEISAVSKQLGIELRVTRATLNETRGVAAARRQQLQKITEKGVPDELLHRVSDQFLEAFIEYREREDATIDQFFEPFERLSDVVQNELGVVLVDVVEDEMLKSSSSTEEIERTIQEESETIRRRKKSPGTLSHDVAHFALVSEERRTHPKTWFLTNDRTIISAASLLLTANDPPVCFGLSGSCRRCLHL